MRKPHTIPDPPEALVDQDVFGMSPTGVLGVLVEERRIQDLAAARELRAVTAWADEHRITDPETEGHGSVDPSVEAMVFAEATAKVRLAYGPLSFAGPDGIEGMLRLCGQNAYLVEEFAITELAAALSMSEGAARSYVGQALELRDRLPRLWERVMSGSLPAWRARRIAERTIPLRDETAGWVDGQVAEFAHKLSLGRVDACVEAAMVRFEPDLADEAARRAADRRGVWTEHHLDGTASVTATTSTPDAVAFEGAVADVAATLAALGDADDLQVRRSRAIGVLADPQHALDLGATLEAAESVDPADLTPAEELHGPRRPKHSHTGDPGHSVIHIHVHTDGEAAVGPVVRVDAPGVHGPRHLTAVDQWLRDAAPGAAINISRVIDLGDRISVDAYEAPARLRDQVDERDLVCSFPWCGRRGRYDLDHIVEYVEPEEGGPPGQTNTDNMARLCRFHHRVKTHSDWHYRREPDRGLLWTSPLGRQYSVDSTGTQHGRS